MKRALNRLTPPLAVVVLLAASWLAAAMASPQINNVPVPPLRTTRSMPPERVEPSAQAVSSPAEELTEVESPDERTGLIVVVTLFAILTVGGTVGWIMVRRRVGAARDAPVVVTRQVADRRAGTSGVVVEAVEASISDLADADASPRTAVIACWVRLERAAAAIGTPRHTGDSPTDLVTRLLTAHQVSQDALDALATVYREARFARHTIDEAMRAQAVAALHQVRVELGGQSVSGGGGRR